MNNILIVDDEPINIQIAAEILSKKYFISIATSGQSALEIIDKNKPDLILLDIIMPNLNGYEVIKILKSNKETENIPVVFLSSKQENDSIIKGFRLGAIDYIIKPFSIEELTIRIDNHIKLHTLSQKLGLELKKSQKNLAIIDEYIAFIKTDISGIIKVASSKFCQDFNVDYNFLIGKNINILKSSNTNFNYKKLWETITGKNKFICDIEDVNFKNGTNWYNVTIFPDFDENNNFIGYIAFYKNIDDKKLVEKQIELQIKELKEKENLRETILNQQSKMAFMGEMVGAIIHQWKQPMNVIALFVQTLTEIIESGDFTKEDISQIEFGIMEQIRFVSHMMSDFKNFLSPPKELTKIKPFQIIKKTNEMFKFQFSKDNIEILPCFDDNFEVLGSQNEFQQVILNILSNAQDALHEKSIQNRSIKFSFELKDNIALIIISDNAGGIQEELLPNKIFEPYVSTKGEKGTGIGLQITKTIIEKKMNGKIWARNNLNGADFIIELPIIKD